MIADSSQIFREGMMAVLQKMMLVDKVVEATSPEEVQSLIDHAGIDIALVDLNFLVDQKNSLMVNFHPKGGSMKMIALATGYEEARFSRLIKAGVSGFLLKSIKKDELSAALEIVSTGKNYYSHEITNEIVQQNFLKTQAPRNGRSIFTLTKREMEILKLICDDMSNDEISRILFISPRTVDGHRSNIINKLGVKGKIGLVKYALKNNLITN